MANPYCRSPLVLVPMRAAYRHSEAVEQWATYQCAAKVLLLMSAVLLVLSTVTVFFPAIASWLTLAVSAAAMASAFWLFQRAGKLRANGVGTLRIEFADTDAMREAGVPPEWIKKLEQADVLFWSKEDRAAYETANAALVAAKNGK